MTSRKLFNHGWTWMNTDKKRIHPWLVAFFVLSGFTQTASACSVCFGDPSSPWAKALGLGILALLAVVLLVLGGIVAFFVFMAKRARASQITTAEELQP